MSTPESTDPAAVCAACGAVETDSIHTGPPYWHLGSEPVESWSHPFKREDSPWVRVNAERYGRELDIIEAAEKLIGTLDVLDSGMSIFKDREKAYDSAVDKLRGAVHDNWHADDEQED